MSSPKKSPKAKKEKFIKVDTKKGIYAVLKDAYPKTKIGMNSESSAAMKSYMIYAMGKFGDFELFQHLGINFLTARMVDFIHGTVGLNIDRDFSAARQEYPENLTKGNITRLYYFVFELLAKYILKIAGNMAQEAKRTRITKYHIDFVIAGDNTLYKIFGELIKARGAFTFVMPHRKEYVKMLRPYDCSSLKISKKQFVEDLSQYFNATYSKDAVHFVYNAVLGAIFNLLPFPEKIDEAIESLLKSKTEESDDTKPYILYKRLVKSIAEKVNLYRGLFVKEGAELPDVSYTTIYTAIQDSSSFDFTF